MGARVYLCIKFINKFMKLNRRKKSKFYWFLDIIHESIEQTRTHTHNRFYVMMWRLVKAKMIYYSFRFDWNELQHANENETKSTRKSTESTAYIVFNERKLVDMIVVCFKSTWAQWCGSFVVNSTSIKSIEYT